MSMSHTSPTISFESPEGAVCYRLERAVYLNLTSRCSLRCRFCPKFHHLWTVDQYYLRLARSEEPDVSTLVRSAREAGACEERIFCGLGEPTMRLDTLVSVARTLQTDHIPLRLNTNGLGNLVHGRDITPELEGRIDHVSISLNAHNAALYERHCRPLLAGSYDAVVDFATRARDHVPRVTLTAIEGLEGVDIDACARTADRIGVEFRIRPMEATDGSAFRVR